jgi:hypothetical protein
VRLGSACSFTGKVPDLAASTKLTVAFSGNTVLAPLSRTISLS